MLRQGRAQSWDKIHPINKQPNLPGVYDNVSHPSLPYHIILAESLLTPNSICSFSPILPLNYFTSLSLRIPGIIQSSFFSKVGGSPTVRDEILRAFIDGRSVTTRVQWLHRFDSLDRCVHCTPLLAHNGGVGVWMVVIVDDDETNWRA